MKKLLILSGKGGTGKTTVAATFIDFLQCSAFADCDVDAPNLHLVARVGVQPERKEYYGSQKARVDASRCVGCGRCAEKCRFDAVSIKDGHCEINEFSCEGCGVCQYVCPQSAVTMADDISGEQRLYRDSRVFSTAKLKMGRGNSGKLVTEVKKALFSATPGTELAIIDGSPGIGCPVIASVSGVDMVLIVTEPSRSGIHDLERIAQTAAILAVKAAVCVNKYDVCPENADIIRRFCGEHEIAFVGCIPYDEAASAAINAGHSLAFVDCPARDALKKLLLNTLCLIEA